MRAQACDQLEPQGFWQAGPGHCTSDYCGLPVCQNAGGKRAVRVVDESLGTERYVT